MDQDQAGFWSLCGIFHFYIQSSIIIELFKEINEDPDQTPRYAASDLVCIICLCPIKGRYAHMG